MVQLTVGGAMQCNYCQKLYSENRNAIHYVWSPTWNSAVKGPVPLCQIHSNIFEFYHLNKKEFVLFGENAQAAFKKIILKEPNSFKIKLRTNYGTGLCEIFQENNNIFVTSRFMIFYLGSLEEVRNCYNNWLQ